MTNMSLGASTKAPSRRTAIVAAFAAFATPLGTQAQPAAPRVRRLVVLGGSAPDPIMVRDTIEPLRLGLRELGHVEGQNLAIEFRWTAGQYDRLPGQMEEMVRLAPDVLVTLGRPAAMAAKEATKTIPIVAVAVDDPVQMGLVASLARPGGNITGISAAFDGILQKRLQLLKDILPAARRFAIFFNPDTIRPEGLAQPVPGWEQALGVTLQLVAARGPDDFDAAFASMAQERAEAVAILADAVVWMHRAKLGTLCQQYRLPSVWGGTGYLDAGGLLSYQGDWPAMFRRSAALVDKILKGVNPGDIPFEQGTKLELAVNLKAAKALGMTIPQRVLVTADVVID
jgi:putative ABC transport system substrate-binding protein